MRHDFGGHAGPVAVRCRIGDAQESEIALLDTACSYTVIGDDAARHFLKRAESAELPQVSLHTRLGTISGPLDRLSIVLPVTEGRDLVVDATALLAADWTGPVVLGFHGFLERIRFGLDPGSAARPPVLYLGPSG